MQQPPARSLFRFAPFGIPTSIVADDSALLDAAIGTFAELGGCIGEGGSEIALRLRWNEIATNGVGLAVSVKGSCLTLVGEGVRGRADSASGTAECSFSRSHREDRRVLADVTETLLLFLLTRAGRIPVHAASVMIGARAVVLAGRSGTGKSSLALAAQRQGLEVLSEDTTYVQLQPRLRFWGWPGAIHLDPADAPQGDFPHRLRGGRLKHAIPRKTARSFAERAILVGIERGSEVELARTDADRLAVRLSPDEPGFDLLRPQIELALAALARGGAWRLTLNDRPSDAISLLQERFGR